MGSFNGGFSYFSSSNLGWATSSIYEKPSGSSQPTSNGTLEPQSRPKGRLCGL
jgi:hypothetical protein